MLYVSTRGQADLVSSAHAIARGLAADGGLFVPQQLPLISLEEIVAMQPQSYRERAITILAKYLTDFSLDELQRSVAVAYSDAKFAAAPAPLVKIDASTAVLELWHGPTAAFKDMALQLLPQLLSCASVKTGECHQIVILVATSGDTGKAALAGFADVAATQIVVFYPDTGVSAMQKLQMITQSGKNVHVFGIEGNFDDAQRGVKAIFTNKKLAQELAEQGYVFSSANSINWGRLVPQIVYYFSAYADLLAKGCIKAGDKVNFVVPTGNFGNILAGYYAKLMGLPVSRLLCASNSNNVLTDFFQSGVYDKNRHFYKTISPSMDILVSSNLERLLYSITDGDTAKVAEYMAKLAATGAYHIDAEKLQQLQNCFFAEWVDETETKETIGRIYAKENYLLDPHSAVAWRALEKYRTLTNDSTFSVVLSTASPYKFSGSVLEALGVAAAPETGPFELLRRLSEVSGTLAPESMLKLEELPLLHNDVIAGEAMEQTLRKILKK